MIVSTDIFCEPAGNHTYDSYYSPVDSEKEHCQAKADCQWSETRLSDRCVVFGFISSVAAFILLPFNTVTLLGVGRRHDCDASARCWETKYGDAHLKLEEPPCLLLTASRFQRISSPQIPTTTKAACLTSHRDRRTPFVHNNSHSMHCDPVNKA